MTDEPVDESLTFRVRGWLQDVFARWDRQDRDAAWDKYREVLSIRYEHCRPKSLMALPDDFPAPADEIPGIFRQVRQRLRDRERRGVGQFRDSGPWRLSPITVAVGRGPGGDGFYK